ncbi:GNAT family N-acetyltransferase [Devosia sp. Naph2]|uniref:GNAT family N-acetyltransferase n=1 Tax=Devosia polycyclovorans TaxID=3345148 RepID=UPI0035CEA979
MDLYQHLHADDDRPSRGSAKRALARLQALPGSGVLIGSDEEGIRSSCTLVVIPNLTRGGRPYALIENVVTHVSARGRGYGKAVLAAAVERAWGEDCYKVMLMTGSQDVATLSFYRSAGFEQTKTGFQIRSKKVT